MLKRIVVFVLLMIFLAWSNSARAKLLVQPHSKYQFQYVIYDEIELNLSIYGRLIQRLETAKPGDVTYIVVTQNRGGSVSTLVALSRSIKKSQGTVYMEARGFIASAAAFLVFQGDMVRIRHSARILFHNVRYMEKGKVVIPSKSNKGTPLRLFTYITSLGWYHHTRVFQLVTLKEWDKLLNGKNVTVLGGNVCRLGAKARVIMTTATFCVARGVK